MKHSGGERRRKWFEEGKKTKKIRRKSFKIE
jgi:hypothetical protein